MASPPSQRQQHNITLRKAQPSEAAQIAALGRDVFSITFGHSITPKQLQAYLDESYSLEAVASDVRDPIKDMIVATTVAAMDAEEELGGREADGAEGVTEVIVGFALLTRNTTEPCLSNLSDLIELQRLYVHPAYHGKGVGKMLIQHLEKMASEHGYKNIWLGVWEENQKAQKVYERMGYQRAGEHDFTMGDVVQTDLVLVKGL